jgi:Tfp pilus assembly protein FimT
VVLRKGFALIELLIILAIAAAVLGLVVLVFNFAGQSASTATDELVAALQRSRLQAARVGYPVVVQIGSSRISDCVVTSSPSPTAPVSCSGTPVVLWQSAGIARPSLALSPAGSASPIVWTVDGFPESATGGLGSWDITVQAGTSSNCVQVAAAGAIQVVSGSACG